MHGVDTPNNSSLTPSTTGAPIPPVHASAEQPPLIAAEDIWTLLDRGEVDWSPQTRSAVAGSGLVFICLRAGGRALGQGWGEDALGIYALNSALEAAKKDVGTPKSPVDTVEIFVCTDKSPVDLHDQAGLRRLLANKHRGVVGISVATSAGVARVSPTSVIATNRKHEKVLLLCRQQLQLTEHDLLRSAQISTLGGFQQLVVRTPQPRSIALLRAKPWVPPEAVTRERIVAFERELGDFLAHSVQPDGRMQYIYYPSRGQEDTTRNNMIRQWMATLALIRTGVFRGDKNFFRLAEDNLRYNIRTFYHAAGNVGAIEYRNKVKLGAVALAAMSVREHPRRKRFKRVEPKLWAMIDYLWRETGEFRTFFKPADRNDVQNFYPGEALLAWAERWLETKDHGLHTRFMKSFAYYRDWHRAQKNPAFTPWHTQAYYLVWEQTRDTELRDFVFEMNDWLLAMQQWDNLEYPDMQGRFHDPQHPEYGPPHASSTGVYMEGLIDAFQMARALGEHERMYKYRRAMLRGLRSSLQLCFTDDLHMFYVRKRKRLRGGLRTTIYDNVVRVDNVQHVQLAVMKILAVFTDEDWAAGVE